MPTTKKNKILTPSMLSPAEWKELAEECNHLIVQVLPTLIKAMRRGVDAFKKAALAAGCPEAYLPVLVAQVENFGRAHFDAQRRLASLGLGLKKVEESLPSLSPRR